MVGEVQVLSIRACREEAQGPKSVLGNVFRTLIEITCKEVILQQVHQEHRDGDVGEEVLAVDVNPHVGSMKEATRSPRPGTPWRAGEGHGFEPK